MNKNDGPQPAREGKRQSEKRQKQKNETTRSEDVSRPYPAKHVDSVPKSTGVITNDRIKSQLS